MSHAIENHIDEHNEILIRRGKKRASPNLITGILVTGILKKATETS
jgi:hypothetical protein